MIYFISTLSGVVNGLFAASAGQILVFYLAFILKNEAHEARSTSIACITVATIITILRYLKFARFDWKMVAIAALGGVIFGIIGSCVMKKIKSKWLNLISGVLVFGLGIYKLICK